MRSQMASVEKGVYQLYQFKRYIFVRAQLPETDNINNARATLPVLFGVTTGTATHGPILTTAVTVILLLLYG